MLTDKQCRNAKCPADKKRVRLTDAHGLYLKVSPAGSKRWFQKLYVGGKDTCIALGSYPAVSLTDVRRKQMEVKAQRAQKLNPIAERRKAQAQQVRGDTFATVAEEWFAKQQTSSAWADGGGRHMDKPISENTMNTALMACDIPREVQSIHGFRVTARTILDEVLGFDKSHIEAQLAHETKAHRGAYDHAKYLPQRAKMMQVWADYLDALADGVEPERAAEIAKGETNAPRKSRARRK